MLLPVVLIDHNWMRSVCPGLHRRKNDVDGCTARHPESQTKHCSLPKLVLPVA